MTCSNWIEFKSVRPAFYGASVKMNRENLTVGAERVCGLDLVQIASGVYACARCDMLGERATA